MADSTLSLDAPFSRHPEQAQFVAAVIASWNTCEHVLASILALVIGTDPWHAGHVVGALASPSAKLELVGSAARYTLADSPRLSEFEALLKTANSVMRTRHTYAHGIYATDERGRLVLVRQGKNWHDPSAQRPLGLAQLRQDLRHSEELLHALTGFHNQLSAEMPVSPSSAWLYKAGNRRPNRAALYLPKEGP